ncbi:MAG: pitrilysin family protein [Candidatus Paceibacterota bacterium]
MNKNTQSKNFKFIRTVANISEYQLRSNGLIVLYKHIPDTDIVTTNLTYLVGSRDEQIGESGVAHMLEHMMFKPTKVDLSKKKDAETLNFEREVGTLLNANTWRDRTTYYFSYPTEHFNRAIRIEAERMRDVTLTDREFLPERTNVLSEYDMYNGDPHFAINELMTCTAFISHNYGHETIGFREDISSYTIEKLERFYNHFYRPNNAVLMVIGDIDENIALQTIANNFKHIEPEPNVNVREKITEPSQEGIRRVEIVRPGKTNILAIGFKHPGFPTKGWFETMLILKLLTEGSEGILNKRLIDTGLASNISVSQSPSKDMDLGTIFITLSSKTSHTKMEELVRKIIDSLTASMIQKQLKPIIKKVIAEEVFKRDSSLDIAAELTEYVASGDWVEYTKTKDTLNSITAKQIMERLKNLFIDKNLTIGSYKSI